MLLILLLPVPGPAEETVPEFLREEQTDEPLKFRSIEIVDRTDTILRITWKTNHAARGRITFGRGERSQRQLRGTARASHSIHYKNLSEGTKYQFRVYAWDNSGHRIKSQVVTARTTGTPPPRFKQLGMERRTPTGGTLRFVTNVPTRAVIRAGHDTTLSYKTTHDSPTRFHEVTLNQFQPDRRLHYRITLEDTRSQTNRSRRKSFRTREPNVAWEKPVGGTFDRTIFGLSEAAQGEQPLPERITDGKFDYQYGLAMSGDPSDTQQWASVDLEQLHTPDTVVLFWWNHAYPRQYSVEASRLGRKWTTLAEDLDAEDGNEVTKRGLPVVRQKITPESRDAYRYVRVRIPEGVRYYGKYPQYNFVALVEMKVFPRGTFVTSSEKSTTRADTARTEEKNTP